MDRWTDLALLGKRVPASVVTLGNFDGFHVGHQGIFRRLAELKKKLALPSVALTFDPHPAVVLGYEAPPLLMTVQQRLTWMERLGVDHSVVVPFDQALALMSAEDFLRSKLLEDLKMRCLCIGATTHIGKRREGTPDRIGILAQKLGFELEVVTPVKIGGDTVSSSRVRASLQAGEVETAAAFLGRPYSTIGPIVMGAGRGTKFGFATANFGKLETVLPRQGVYATRARLEGREFMSVTNVGVRPTVVARSPVTVETHIFDFSDDLRGAELEVSWVKRLRDERKFASISELTAQIGRDVADARLVLEKA